MTVMAQRSLKLPFAKTQSKSLPPVRTLTCVQTQTFKTGNTLVLTR